MIFKKKAVVLSALVAVLVLVYIFSFVIDPERPQTFAFLDEKMLALADRIEIYGSGGKTLLSRKNNIWVFSAGTTEYPVKQGRVEDLLQALSRRNVFPLRAVSPEGRERLGLVEGRASRILVRGGAGLPLLDLLIGTGDALGREIYLRKAGANEIYSGEDHFTLYTESKPSSWYNLRLFSADTPPETSPGTAAGSRNSGVDVAMVQQAEISLPESTETFTLRRHGEGWIIPGNESFPLDTPKVESWLRSVLEAEGVDFSAETPASVEGSVTFRLGNGTARTIQAGPPDEQKRRSATVSNSPLTYILSEWTLNRLFRESGYFFKTQ